MTKIVSLEEWRPIEGYEGFYEVSNLGRVRSLDRVVKGCPGQQKPIKGRLLKPLLRSHGYLYVCLCKEGKKKNYFIHRLVAVAFLGQPPEGHVVCHGSKGQQCNKVTNLSWGTYKQNSGPDRVRDGTDKRGEKHGLAKLNEMQVRVIRRLIESKTMTNREIGEIFGVSKQCIKHIKSGRSWKHLKPAKA